MKYIKSDKEKYEEYKKEEAIGILEIYKMEDFEDGLIGILTALKEIEEDTAEEDYLLSMINKHKKNYNYIVIKLNNAIEYVIVDYLNLKNGDI